MVKVSTSSDHILKIPYNWEKIFDDAFFELLQINSWGTSFTSKPNLYHEVFVPQKFPSVQHQTIHAPTTKYKHIAR